VQVVGCLTLYLIFLHGIKMKICGRELTGNFAWDCDFHVNLGIFYTPQINDMGPTALLPFRRKACWGFFRAENSWRLRPGLNPRTWVLKGSTLPLDHRSLYMLHLHYLLVSKWRRKLSVFCGITKQNHRSQYSGNSVMSTDDLRQMLTIWSLTTHIGVVPHR